MKTNGVFRRLLGGGLGALAISVACCWGQAAGAENWPQFRGPTGLGYTRDTKLPVQWGGKEGRNILWTSPLVGQGHASPIVWAGRVFVCTARWPAAVKDRKKVIPEQHVLCYRASDGKLLWDRKIPPGPWVRTDFRSGPGGGYAAPTPTTDGKLLYCAFGSSVVAALDFEGKIIWREEIVPHTFDVTPGSSPILYRDTLILLCAMAVKKDSRIVAFNKADGSIDWEQSIAPTAFAHSTPVIIRSGQKDQMIVVASGGGDSSHGIQSFDPAGGKRLWWCKGQGDASSAAFGSGIVYADSGRGGPGVAVAIGGKGNVTKTHIKWTGPRITEAIGSPIIVGKFLYRLTRNKRVRCWGLADGNEVYSEKLEGISTTWASPVADPRGRIYFASAGKSYVIQAGAKFKLLAVNDLGDGNHPTPAVAGGKIFLVGMKNVYCIGQLSASSPAPETPTPSTPLTVDKGARAGVKITDATDKQIVQRFLEHVDRLPRWITREYCRKMAADEPEGYTWKVLPQVEMYLTAFEVTGDAKYLDGFAAVFAGMRAAMTKGPDGYLGWYGKPLGLFRNPAKADLKADVIISSFRTVDVLCRFLELAARDDSLAKRFAPRRREYVDLMVNHLVKKWTARGNYVDLGDRGAIYRTHAGLRDTKGHLTQPHNKHSKIIRGLLGLYRVTGRSEYMQMAVKLGVRFKRCLTLRNGHYEWNYWDPAGPWDVHPTKPGQWKHWIGPEHRGGYYSLSLTQAVGLWRHGLLFDDADMRRFVKTQLEATWNGRLDDPKWFRVDRSRGTQDGRYICPALAPFDKKIHTFLYTGPRQAERLANAKHSWQGGPVANGWIRGKYINHPAAAGGKQIHLAAGKKFLTEPANRKFMQSQRFDVTGGGYRAQPNPK